MSRVYNIPNYEPVGMDTSNISEIFKIAYQNGVHRVDRTLVNYGEHLQVHELSAFNIGKLAVTPHVDQPLFAWRYRTDSPDPVEYTWVDQMFVAERINQKSDRRGRRFLECWTDPQKSYNNQGLTYLRVKVLDNTADLTLLKSTASLQPRR